MIDNAWNFSPDELREWAYSDTQTVPDQDWELAVCTSGYDSLVLELAESAECPNNRFMTVCLYMMVGDLLHCGLSSERKQEVFNLIEKALLSKEERIIKWAEKATYIVNNPKKFVYDEWCWVSENDV